MAELLNAWQDFMDAGGPVLWPIFACTVLLWGFILERYWYLYREHPRAVASAEHLWRQRSESRSWFARQIREAHISAVASELSRFVSVIKTLVAVLPMLGLLGTVTGMIRVFEVMAVMGTGNPRAMAEGISAATIPTMAGLVAALSGLYFSIHLDRRVRTERQRLRNRLSLF